MILLSALVRARLILPALLMTVLLPLALPLSAADVDADAAAGGYRLLKLDGYMVKWGDRRLGAGARISYAFAGESLRFDNAINCRDMAPIEALLGQTLSGDALAREAAAAFRVWESAADVSFYEVSDAGDADIVIGAQGRPQGRAYASVSYAPDPQQEGVRAIEQGLICLNPEHEWKIGFDGDTNVYDIRYTLIHEIGHAIGLDHPGPSGQVMGFRYTESFAELQPGDLRGAQRLYGPAQRSATRLAAISGNARHDEHDGQHGGNRSSTRGAATVERALAPMNDQSGTADPAQAGKAIPDQQPQSAREIRP